MKKIIGYIENNNYIKYVLYGLAGSGGGLTTYMFRLITYILNNYSNKFFLKLGGLYENLSLNKSTEKYDIIITKKIKTNNIIHYPYNQLYLPLKMAYVAKKMGSVNLFHLNNFQDGGLIKFLKPDSKIIYTIHGGLLPRNIHYKLSPYYSLEDKYAYLKLLNGIKNSDAIITVGKGMDPELYKITKKYRKKIFLILNGVDVSKFSPNVDGSHIREKYNIPENATLIISTSRFSYQRRIELLIKSFARLTKKDLNAYLMIVGYGEREREFKNLVKALKIGKRVIFPGYVSNSEMPQYYAAADIAFHSFTDVPCIDSFIHYSSLKKSIKNNLPITREFSLIEALSTGIPVISVVKRVRNYHTVDYKILKNDAGAILPENKPEIFTSVLETLIKHPELRDEMGKNAREIAVKERNMEKMIKSTLSVYSYVLEN